MRLSLGRDYMVIVPLNCTIFFQSMFILFIENIYLLEKSLNFIWNRHITHINLQSARQLEETKQQLWRFPVFTSCKVLSTVTLGGDVWWVGRCLAIDSLSNRLMKKLYVRDDNNLYVQPNESCSNASLYNVYHLSVLIIHSLSSKIVFYQCTF